MTRALVVVEITVSLSQKQRLLVSELLEESVLDSG